MGESLREPSDRRWIPVRLCDLPEDVRMRAAETAAKDERDEEARLLLLYAAMFPSNETYWVAPSEEAA